MVYESDFYTTRRPYSRPTVTSYSVTAQTFHHSIPFVAHKRLTGVTPPAHTVRVRPSIILAEIDRINHKVRPSLAYQPAEDFLNSRSVVSFDDEARSIRAQTAALLKRIHEPLPRATKTFPISVTRYEETPIPERITSDAYIYRLLGPTHNVKQEVLTMSHYDEPAKRLMGKGHLACVSFAGGRAFPRRKNLFYDDDRVKNDVQYLSHYKKNIEAAENPQQTSAAALSADWYRNAAAYISPPRSRPISRFYRPTFVPDENLSYYEPPASPTKRTGSTSSQSQRSAETSSTARTERQSSLKEDGSEDTEARSIRRKKKRQEEARLAEQKALEGQAEIEKKKEAAREAELARQEKLAQEAALERQKEIDRKAELARQAEEEAERQAELERQEAERKAEAERQAELERQEAERKAEAERQAELERQEAERKAEAERQAELERQEAERKAEAERQAELERQEAERKAEEERQAEVERQKELERQAEIQRQEEELAKLEAEAKEAEATSVAEATSESLAEKQELVPEIEGKEESEEKPIQEEEVKASETVTIPGSEEESGPEPVVEEPLSPETHQEPTTGNIIEEIHDAGIPEEEEEE
ncbi:uncharacterized abhydrolase domain-containing protein DDB_G0269086 isoform X2 [Cryptotermes secundus]|uniref:uncharacterized abhydrolase domain-containing protein DDB_G0269086 isoform X2 n=1 Tax=Cryptotermes secundus TaxID=105785 RepID=UPI000CD7BECD|nr:uncharacterized abhydrolase domain-containing protein DDB_G0269086 isoform X2 [Cryptotermes secundus]